MKNYKTDWFNGKMQEQCARTVKIQTTTRKIDGIFFKQEQTRYKMKNVKSTSNALKDAFK